MISIGARYRERITPPRSLFLFLYLLRLAARHQSIPVWAISTNLVVYVSSLLERNAMEKAPRIRYRYPKVYELVAPQIVMLAFVPAGSKADL